MNYLQLVQRASRECSISGDGPISTIGQVGMYARMANWVNDALNDIEIARPSWGWMYKSYSFATISGQAEYTPLQCGMTDFENWDLASLRNYVTTIGNMSEIEMGLINYEDWRRIYDFGANRYVASRPISFAISPTFALALGPYPNSLYTVTGRYYRSPQILLLDADTPLLDANYHMMIVYKAMMYYGGYMSAPEAYDRGELEYSKMMRRLSNQRLPPVDFG